MNLNLNLLKNIAVLVLSVLSLVSSETIDSSIIIQPVSFVVTYASDGSGHISYSQVEQQIDVLNNALYGLDAKNAGRIPVDYGIRFKLAGVRYIKDDKLFNLCILPSTIKSYRPTYMMSPSKHLNVYVCWCENMLGLSWLPYDRWYTEPVSEHGYYLGAIVHWKLVSGNTNFTNEPSPSYVEKLINSGIWSIGKTLVHEVGHHMGLRHPYGDNCSGPDPDAISDTPRMKGNPLTKCSKIRGRNSCPNFRGRDDISNYMLMTNDACKNHFTKGQVQFMRDTIEQYKPTLLKQVPPDCVAGIFSEDNSPDLQPCIVGTVKNNTKSPTGLICQTDPRNSAIIGFACCPTNMDWEKDSCRQGTPVF